MIFLIIYFVIGVILAFYWWDHEYKDDYEYERTTNNADENLAVLFIALMVFLWPLKLCYKFYKKVYKILNITSS